MEKLSLSYLATLDLLEQDKVDEAAKEYTRGFVAPMKKLYSEAAETYPLRFSKMDEWCKWTKRVYIWTRRTEETFKKNEPEKAAEYLPLFREYFYVLHEKAKVLKSNDHIYAFHKELGADEPSLDALRSVLEALEEAEPSMKAEADEDTYRQAKAKWRDQVTPILEAESLTPGQLDQLRQITTPFYRDLGIQFE